MKTLRNKISLVGFFASRPLQNFIKFLRPYNATNNSESHLLWERVRLMKSQTCVQRPPMGPEKSALLSEVSDKTEI